MGLLYLLWVLTLLHTSLAIPAKSQAYQNRPRPVAQRMNQTQRYIKVTAITAVNRISVLQCWEIENPFTVSTTSGTSGALTASLGPVQSPVYTLIAARFFPERHPAPKPQYVWYISGEAHITVPGQRCYTRDDCENEVTVIGGEHGLIIAADTTAVSDDGHLTEYRSYVGTTALQLPFVDGKWPIFNKIRNGPCTRADLELSYPVVASSGGKGYKE